MATISELTVAIKADTTGLSAGVKEATSSIKSVEAPTKSLNDKLEGLKGAFSAAAAGAIAMGKAVVDMVADFGEAEDASKRLNAVARMNNVGFATDRINELALSIEKLTGIDGDLVNQLAAEQIAQGKSVAQTEEMIRAATDLSAVTGDDLSTSIQLLSTTYSGATGKLGKMLPAVKDLTAEQLANGDAVRMVADAYRGLAEEMGDNASTSLAKATNAVGNLREMLGEQFSPVVKFVADGMTSLVEVITTASPIIKGVFTAAIAAAGGAMAALAIKAGVAAAAKMGLFAATQAVNAALAVANPLLWAGIAAATAAAAAVWLHVDAKKKELEETIKGNAESSNLVKARNNEKTATENLTKAIGKMTDAQLENRLETIKGLQLKATSIKELESYEKEIKAIKAEQAARKAAAKETENQKKAEEELKKTEEERARAAEEQANLEAGWTAHQNQLDADRIAAKIEAEQAANDERVAQLVAEGEAIDALASNEAAAAARVADAQVEAARRAEAEKKTIREQAEKAITDVMGQIDDVAAAFFDRELGRVDQETQEKLKALGLVEKTSVETAQEKLDAAIAAGDEEAIKAAELELKKAKILEEGEKKKARIKYDSAMWQYGIDMANLAVNTTLAIMRAYSDLGPIGGTAAAIGIGSVAAAQAAIATANLPTPPAFANGTNFAPGGIARVGERGPEDVYLPKGSQVIPNDQLSRGGNTFIFQSPIALDAGGMIQAFKRETRSLAFEGVLA